MMHGKNHQKRNRNKRRADFLAGLRFETLEKRELLAADLGFDVTPEGEGGHHDHDHGHGSLLSGYYAPATTNLGSGLYISQPVLGESPTDVALQYFKGNAAQFGVEDEAFDSYILKSSYLSQHTRVTHVALQQSLNGLPVENAYATASVDNDGRVLAAASSFVSGLAEYQQTGTFNPNVTSGQAFANLASALGYTVLSNPTQGSPSVGLSQLHQLSGGGVADTAVKVELRYVPTASGVSLAWALNFTVSDDLAAYDAFVSADTGDPIYALNRVVQASYTVYPSPGQSPVDTVMSVETDVNNVNLEASPFGWHDTDGMAGHEFTDTRGNNVFAMEGAEGGRGYNANGIRAIAGDDLVFDYPYDQLSNASVPENIEAQSLQAFYVMNIVHDSLHNYGFDEAAGNFQATNYTGTGVGGDQVIISVADPDAPCNANALPTLDGTPTTIQMGVCAAAAPSRGSAMDNDILIHEFGHSLLERLTAGPLIFSGRTGADGDQMGAMHEGFSDFLGLWYSMDMNDAPDSPEYMGEYYIPPEGVRRNPYAHDLSLNPITFDSWNDEDDAFGNPNHQIHSGGEIWASALYDLTWELIFKYGGARDETAMPIAFNEDIYDSVGAASGRRLPFTTNAGWDELDLTTGANNLALQLVIDGAKLTQPLPTFVDMRNGILAADTALTGGINHDAIWRAFARRGLGYSAVADDGINGNQTVPINTSFDMPSTSADVAGVVFLDADSDGVRDLNESALEGVTIFLDVNGNGELDRLEPKTVTDERGEYNFVLYAGGQFKVKAVPPMETIQTFPDPSPVSGGPANDGSHDVYVPIGQSASDINFGFRPFSDALGVFGTKYTDVNGNGIQDDPVTEPGLEGVYIYLDHDLDGRIDIGEPAAVTDQDGNYAIEFEGSGDVRVREVLSPGWQITDPAIGYHDITIVAGIPAIEINFGNQPMFDYGDAPESYGTLNADGGASHGFLDGLKIGSLLDWEIDGNPSLNADGDDGRDVDDEDGVIFEDNYLVLGQSESVVVDITNGENSAGVLQGWIDFNGDGVFNDEEQIVTNLAVAEGANPISFDVPADAVVGDTYARFRYAYERDLGPTGWTMAGEVEDYKLFISDDKPYAVDDVEVVTENSTNNIIEALANDIASPAGPLTITNITQGTEGGSVTIIGGGLKLAYTPAQGFTSPPFDTFTYTVSDPNGDTDTATVSVRVTPEFNDPTAVDDYFPFILGDAAPENLTWQPLDVLANDVAGVNGLALLPSNGAAAFPGLAEIEPGEYDTGNGCVRLVANSSGEYEIEYKPNDGFFDMDSFEYAAFDALGTETRANVTIQVQPNANANDEIKFTVEFPGVIGDVAVGETFTVQVSVDDDRSGMSTDDMGVFAAYMDLLYDSDLVSVVESTPTIVYDAEFPNGHSGNYDTPGIV
ncbi:MAG: M36 family metallopeptidase [Pirellulaceae bacterium]